jgi:hypothetical protein
MRVRISCVIPRGGQNPTAQPNPEKTSEKNRTGSDLGEQTVFRLEFTSSSDWRRSGSVQ